MNPLEAHECGVIQIHPLLTSGFPYAASFYGIKTLWASEIMPAAISVTRRHFPDMEHLGDITRINGGEIPPVNIVTFGSPCQSYPDNPKTPRNETG